MGAVAEFRSLRKVYRGRTEALKGVDLSIEEGGAVGLIGPNGAGKTTLAKLLLGLLRPTSGTVWLWDHQCYDLPHHLRLKIGFLLEERGVYENLTVEENLTFWAKLYEVNTGRVERTLKEWNLSDKRKELVKTLSAGMKQKLAIARSVLHDPPFIIMDEPTSNLDPSARKNVVDLLKSHTCRSKTTLVTSHDLFDIERICTRIVLLRRGTIAAQGTMEELRRQLRVGREVRIRVSQEIPEDIKQTIAETFVITTIKGNELTVSDDTTDVKDLVRYFVEQGVDVERVEERKLTLEDIYTTIVKEDEKG